MIGIVSDILFPSRCVSCGKPAHSHQNNVCSRCKARIRPLADACPICSGRLTAGSCGTCSERHWYVAKNITVAEYSGVIKDIIHAVKFKKIRALTRFLGSLAHTQLVRHGIRADLITWVPMNGKKRWQRGFNQSKLIAKHLSRENGTPNRPLLMEKTQAATQREQCLRDRFINALIRYKTRPGAELSGKSILLIDDVYTTGATINECARTLLSAGAVEVFSLTIARTDIKRLEKL